MYLFSNLSHVCPSIKGQPHISFLTKHWAPFSLDLGSCWTWQSHGLSAFKHIFTCIHTCSTSSSCPPLKQWCMCFSERTHTVGETQHASSLVSFSQSERYSGGRGQRHPAGQFTALLWEFHMIQVWEWRVGKARAVNSPWQFYLDCQIKQYLLFQSCTLESLARSTLAPSHVLVSDKNRTNTVSLARPIKVCRGLELHLRTSL